MHEVRKNFGLCLSLVPAWEGASDRNQMVKRFKALRMMGQKLGNCQKHADNEIIILLMMQPPFPSTPADQNWPHTLHLFLSLPPHKTNESYCFLYQEGPGKLRDDDQH
ncbi:hypothetical protein DKX38_017643 [Salix brachista]|uniref:Uncharacterized protein n=1 Tax=Salix brachista TaxID=2182728 RepID=A0A5N5KVW7_9ROSI|nr:hypothetical protein DKX38_017643 [Salix brachista]